MPTSDTVLRFKARQLWLRYRSSESRPTEDERKLLTEAYWACVLPDDYDYNVAQWVEDGFPAMS